MLSVGRGDGGSIDLNLRRRFIGPACLRSWDARGILAAPPNSRTVRMLSRVVAEPFLETAMLSTKRYCSWPTEECRFRIFAISRGNGPWFWLMGTCAFWRVL